MAGPQYVARYDRALRQAAQSQAAGRLAASFPVTLRDGSGAEQQVGTPFELMGPGDVEGLAPGTIVRRYPVPGAGDAEGAVPSAGSGPGKIALVEFADIDLPWRYTPQLPDGDTLRPWLVLVVGEPGAGGIAVRPDGTVAIAPKVLVRHPLSQSSSWAHVHEVGSFTRSRLLCPAELLVSTRYVAVLVPAFTAAGAPAWADQPGGTVTLPCFDAWSFATGADGSFLALAQQLTGVTAAALTTRAGGRKFGRAELGYEHRATGAAFALQAAGALRAPSDEIPDPADEPPSADVAADVAALLDQSLIPSPDGRDVITAPDYPAGFRQGGTTSADGGGWAQQVVEDPRLRGAAGLGAWNAIAWQERIVDAAASVLGDTTIAAERIRALALGVMVSRSLWRRRVPEDPVHRLVVLAPSLPKLPAAGGGFVGNQLAGHTPQLGPTLLSLAARRALRAGTGRSRLARPGAHAVPALVAVAADCPDRTLGYDVLESPEPEPGDPWGAVKEAIYAATDEPHLAEAVLEHMPQDERLLARWVAAVLSVMAPDADGRVDEERVLEAAARRRYPALDLSIEGWREVPDEFAPPCGLVDVHTLGEAVGAAVDPTVSEPPAARRVWATMPGVRSLRPLAVEPELDIPLWSFLSQESPDWMLPGVGDLREHEVIGVETNPMFVRALLLGANHQVASELRWRNVPLVPGSSPLRRFWQRVRDPVGAAGADTGLDIRPVRSWSPTVRLDDVSLTPTGLGSEAVVVFRSPIFRRFPSTVVYLYPAARDWTPPWPGMALDAARRIDPTFTGTIGPDVTFFGFPVNASALKRHWVVLEEPPPGYTFYSQDQSVPGGTKAHSGGYAKRRFALPVRVLIGPLL